LARFRPSSSIVQARRSRRTRGFRDGSCGEGDRGCKVGSGQFIAVADIVARGWFREVKSLAFPWEILA